MVLNHPKFGRPLIYEGGALGPSYSCSHYSYMKNDSRLSSVLHVLLHMAELDRPATSEDMAKILSTNPVVIRRIMAGLREAGSVHSEKGHGCGWRLTCDLASITLRDVYLALGEPGFSP